MCQPRWNDVGGLGSWIPRLPPASPWNEARQLLRDGGFGAGILLARPVERGPRDARGPGGGFDLCLAAQIQSAC
jgi:hypothetical protein